MGRGGLLKGEFKRAGLDFRVLVVCKTGEAGAGREELLAGFQAVVDCTGTYGQHCWLGEGGLPALGERRMADTEEGTTVVQPLAHHHSYLINPCSFSQP